MGGFVGSGLRRCNRNGRRAGDAIGTDRFGNVPQGLRSEIVEANVDFVADVIVGRPGDENSAGFGHRLQARGDVDAVAEQFAAIGHYVAEIDANPELHLEACWQIKRLPGYAHLKSRHQPAPLRPGSRTRP